MKKYLWDLMYITVYQMYGDFKVTVSTQMHNFQVNLQGKKQLVKYTYHSVLNTA